MNNYIKRFENLKYRFSKEEILSIHNDKNNIKFNDKCSLLHKGEVPNRMYDIKESDSHAIELWNEITSESIQSLDDIKMSAERIINSLNSEYPNGHGMGEKEYTIFITAQSVSSFIGIQDPRKSRISYMSMKNTLESHAMATIKERSWLIDNLSSIAQHIYSNPHIMERSMGDVLMNAKMSSSSIPGYPKYREFLFTNKVETLYDMIEDGIDHSIYTGTRQDRRGKYRLICSFHGVVRAVDYLLNNGSYTICEGEEILSPYTTEGVSSNDMWVELYKMSERGDYVMICLDYKGYDTQISMYEYIMLSELLNKHRLKDHEFKSLFNWYYDWMVQPKPLLSKTSEGVEVVIPYFRTLASGLHGTHSFENLIGISTMMEAENRGIEVKMFKSNGDDQNILIHKSHINEYLNFINSNFEISVEKSLIGHKLAVWGKLWFASDYHPCWEVGTFRSIWEKEKGQIDVVEESKFKSNYCKILQVAIVLMRIGKSKKEIMYWIYKLSNECSPRINPNKLPKTLNNIIQIKSKSNKNRGVPVGLFDVESDISSRNLDFKLFGTSDMYELMLGMHESSYVFTEDIEEIEYHDSGTELYMYAGVDYSLNENKNIPYLYRKLEVKEVVPQEHTFVTNVLQGTKSFEGITNTDYKFTNMYTLAKCINARNKEAWVRLSYKV